MALGLTLFGCRSESLGKSIPSMAEFEAEVRRAMSQMKGGFELVQIPMPKKVKHPDASAENRFGMAIDLDACDACGKCILACNQENNIPMVSEEQAKLGRFMHWIEMRGGIPTMCFHCGDAPCEKVCPTGAASHTPDGLSTMMYKRCAGSRFCGANCPVNARKFNFEDAAEKGLSRKFNGEVPVRGKGVMEKCSLCIQRLQNDRTDFKAKNVGAENTWHGKGLKTACAESCHRNAIIFGNWLDPESDLVKMAKNRKLYVPKGIAALDPSIVYMRGRR